MRWWMEIVLTGPAKALEERFCGIPTDREEFGGPSGTPAISSPTSRVLGRPGCPSVAT